MIVINAIDDNKYVTISMLYEEDYMYISYMYEMKKCVMR